MFKKKCYECGKENNELFEGKCFKCINKNNEIITEIKTPNFKICNQTKKIFIQNMYYENEEIITKLPRLMKKNIKLNLGFKIKEISIDDYVIEGNTMKFNCNLEIEKS
jgi:NMD protein affecting ribosome stability and mRNA decay